MRDALPSNEKTAAAIRRKKQLEKKQPRAPDIRARDNGKMWNQFHADLAGAQGGKISPQTRILPKQTAKLGKKKIEESIILAQDFARAGKCSAASQVAPRGRGVGVLPGGRLAAERPA